MSVSYGREVSMSGNRQATQSVLPRRTSGDDARLFLRLLLQSSTVMGVFFQWTGAVVTVYAGGGATYNTPSHQR